MSFASIFVPDFPVEAVLRAEPELRSQAVAVLEGKPPLQKVFAVNEKSRRAGIEVGITRLQAEACPELALRNRSALQEAAAHAALLDCAQSFSPRVEDTACDAVVLDISGTEALFGPPARLARDLARRASDLGLECNVAVAASPDAATLAARGFAGVTVIPPGKEEERLGNLPLDVLFAGQAADVNQEGNDILDTLERWGIRNLRTLATLPEVAISERLGEKGVYLQKLARGAVSRTIVPVDPPLVFEEAIELEHPLVLLEPLAFLLGRLLDQLCARLSAHALATQELRLKLELDAGAYFDEEEVDIVEEEDGTTTDHVVAGALARPGRAQARQEASRTTSFTRTLRLPLPMLDAKVFLKLLQLDLKAHPPGAPIVKIWLAAEPARLRAAQGGLFLPPTPEPEKLELTLARISGIVGEGKAGSLEVLDTHRRDAFRMQHFTPPPPVQKPKNGAAGQKSAVTALRIFRPALRAAVTLRDGRPARLVCEKRREVQGEIIWQAGPWRSSGDWWEQHAWARDEWDIAVQTQAGVVLYRLVHDLLSGRWLVEGTYD
jgi:protein ImuB